MLKNPDIDENSNKEEESTGTIAVDSEEATPEKVEKASEEDSFRVVPNVPLGDATADMI